MMAHLGLHYRPVILTVALVATLLMTGIILLVQLVHYPSFEDVSKGSFSDFHKNHIKRITPLVGVLMIVELVSTLLLFNGDLLPTLALVCLLLIFIWTYRPIIKLHDLLEVKHSPEIIDQLIWSNWVRTLLWTLKSLFLVFYTFG